MGWLHPELRFSLVLGAEGPAICTDSTVQSKNHAVPKACFEFPPVLVVGRASPSRLDQRPRCQRSAVGHTIDSDEPSNSLTSFITATKSCSKIQFDRHPQPMTSRHSGTNCLYVCPAVIFKRSSASGSQKESLKAGGKRSRHQLEQLSSSRRSLSSQDIG